MKLNIMIAVISISAISIMTSCNNEELKVNENLTNPDVSQITKLSNVDAQKAFAKLLSKAVSNSEDVRAFIKKEALAQFDNDYDVFYPFVKNKVVRDGKTFRDIMVSYCDKEEELVQIEESSLLLNILVPDLTLFWDFSAENWDTSSNDIAVISRDDSEHMLYEDGEELGVIESDEVPGFPCLVVNNNKRMLIRDRATRASSASYEFANDLFNPSKTGASTRHSYWSEYPEPMQSDTPYAKADELDPVVINAYNEFSEVGSQGFQRDNIYFGITKTQPSGEWKRNVFEELFLFRISYRQFKNISDDGGDPQLQDTSQEYRGLSSEEIIRRVWTNGQFDLNFKVYLSRNSGNPELISNILIPVTGTELFSIEKVNVEYQNKTWFRPNKWTYKVSDIRSKWVRPKDVTGFNKRVYLFQQIPWNISQDSYNAYVYIYENDPSVTTTITENKTFEYATNVNFEVNPAKIIKIGAGVSASSSESKSIQKTFQTGSDDLGMMPFYYTYPVIVDDDEKSGNGYELGSINDGGAVEIVVIPRRL